MPTPQSVRQALENRTVQKGREIALLSGEIQPKDDFEREWLSQAKQERTAQHEAEVKAQHRHNNIIIRKQEQVFVANTMKKQAMNNDFLTWCKNRMGDAFDATKVESEYKPQHFELFEKDWNNIHAHKPQFQPRPVYEWSDPQTHKNAIDTEVSKIKQEHKYKGLPESDYYHIAQSRIPAPKTNQISPKEKYGSKEHIASMRFNHAMEQGEAYNTPYLKELQQPLALRSATNEPVQA